MTNTKNEKIFRLTALSLLAAMAVVLAGLVHVPIIPAAPFLEYDPADIPVLIGAFLYGPVAGIGLTLVVSVLQGITVSASGGPIGILMHILATTALCTTASLIYRRRRTYGTALAALFLGAIAQTVIMCLFNLIFTPIFLGSPLEEVIELLVPGIIPFNMIKGLVNGVGALLIYKPVRLYLSKKGLTNMNESV